MPLSALLIQNLVHLVKDLKLPVAYKVSELGPEASSSSADGERSFLIIVHVMGDHAFKKYLAQCSRTDLMLFRGLLLKVGGEPPAAPEAPAGRPLRLRRGCHASYTMTAWCTPPCMVNVRRSMLQHCPWADCIPQAHPAPLHAWM